MKKIITFFFLFKIKFSNCKKLDYINFGDINIHNVKTMDYMFQGLSIKLVIINGKYGKDYLNKIHNKINFKNKKFLP